MNVNFTRLKDEIKAKALEICGFHSFNVTENLPVKGHALLTWLALNCHGQMEYMAKEPHKRFNPKHLLPEVKSIVFVTIPYKFIDNNQTNKINIASYALGRDYHKIMRSRLKKLIRLMVEMIGPFQYRIFVDSAPILEKSFAKRAGVGWIGKNTLLIQKTCGSFFVIGGFCSDLPLPKDEPNQINHCGTCERCINACPTAALTKPYQLNASRCIAYLTMEHKGSIPLELRSKMGTHIFGCDVCQAFCPWNQKRIIRFIDDFQPRQWYLSHNLISLFHWKETEFLSYTEGSSMRRMGYECFLRNVAIALGNSRPSMAGLKALKSRQNHPSLLVQEHVNWAIARVRYRLYSAE